MGPGETVALVAVAVPVLVVLALAADLYKRRLEFMERQFELMSQAGVEKSAHYAALIERLDHRVRVLEQIATERGLELAKAMENLRDAKAGGKGERP